ncbi:sterol reductase [Pseudozyma hubeiensis SY62]|uniref:Sterol reductase n=1 Tax=Pseudozyma hubeiensis (strain SY62) TaxID=1305764 RepID=R9PHU0_PSEHS|nr:sterol reductase [Pseudozyma hubeiensis SY62]GAC97675.1 sterol reductase [Pseudozyma hubeiensis SY62]
MSTTAAADNHVTASPAAKVKGAGEASSTAGAANARWVKFSSPKPSPKLQSSSRFARINGISNGNANGHANGDADGTATPPAASRIFYPLFPGIVSALDESPWASGYNTPIIGSAIHNVAERTEEALQKLASNQRKGGILEKVANKTIDFADYIERVLQWHLFSRFNAIGGIDNMWLLIDGISSFNPVCTATYTFKQPPKLDDLKEAVVKQTAHFPKYKQRLADVGRFFHGTVFIDDENFDVNHHIQSYTLPGKAGKEEMEAFASEFIARDWDYSRPLWETVVLENYVDEQSGAKGALVIRGHHTLADGQGFIMSQLFITSLGPKLESMMDEGAKLLSDAKQGKALPSRMNKKLAGLDRFHGTIALQLVMMALYWISWFVGFVTDLLGCVTLAVSTSFFFVTTSWRQRYVTASYEGERKSEKEFSVSRSFTLADVKLVSKAFSGVAPGTLLDKVQGGKRYSRPLFGTHLTVNDIICTVIADVINDELDRQPLQPGLLNKLRHYSHKILPSPIGIMIPISIREPGDWSLRNLSTGGIAYLPTTKGLSTEPATLHRRLHTTHSRLNILKNSLLPKIFFHAIQLTGQIPAIFPIPFGLLPKHRWNVLRWPTVWVTERILTCFTAVVTNVPCPSKQRIELAGQEVVRWTALPPQAGKGTLGIGICSYGGDFSISISADRVEGSEGVAARLTGSFERRWEEYVETSRKLIKDTGSERKEKREKRAARAEGDKEGKPKRRRSSASASSAESAETASSKETITNANAQG